MGEEVVGVSQRKLGDSEKGANRNNGLDCLPGGRGVIRGNNEVKVGAGQQRKTQKPHCHYSK